MTFEQLADMTTEELARLLGVRVTRGVCKNGCMVRKVFCEGDNTAIAEVRGFKLRMFLISTALDFDAGGAFA